MRPSTLLNIARPAAHVVVEAIAVGRVAAYYPTGLSDRISGRLCASRWSVAPTRRLPVLLLHGIWHNQSWAVRLERTLTEQGYACRSVNYRTLGCGIDDAAAQVARQARKLAEDYDVDQVHVVAHSLGGVVLRAAVTRHDLDVLVAAAVTIGSPHTGSPLALALSRHLPAVGEILGQIGCGSRYLTDLDRQTAATPGVSWTAIYSTADEIVPGKRARLDHPALAAHNIEIPGVGHLRLAADPTVIRCVLTALAAADTDLTVEVPTHLTAELAPAP